MKCLDNLQEDDNNQGARDPEQPEDEVDQEAQGARGVSKQPIIYSTF